LQYIIISQYIVM